jgi:hypothetical protein
MEAILPAALHGRTVGVRDIEMDSLPGWPELRLF